MIALNGTVRRRRRHPSLGRTTLLVARFNDVVRREAHRDRTCVVAVEHLAWVLFDARDHDDVAANLRLPSATRK